MTSYFSYLISFEIILVSGTDVEVEHEPPKRQRKWNSDHELAKVSAARPSRLDKENFADATQTSSPVAASNLHLLSPRDKTQGVKLSRTDSNIDSDAPKERVGNLRFLASFYFYRFCLTEATEC